jgi:hypothetical protein
MIFLDIRAKIPPAKHPARLPSNLELMWTGLEHCWDICPENRPSATVLLAWLEEQMASRMLEADSNGIRTRGQAEGALQRKEDNGRELYRQYSEKEVESEEDVGVAQSLQDWSHEIAAIEDIRTKGTVTPSLIEGVHARVRTHSQTSLSTSRSSSSGYLPSIHSRLSNDPDVASVRSIPGIPSSLEVRSRIPFFDDIVTSPELFPDTLPANPRKSHESLQAARSNAQSKRGYGDTSGGHDHEQKTRIRGDKANLSHSRRRGDGISSGDYSTEIEKTEIPVSVTAEEVCDSFSLGKCTVDELS